MSNKLLSSLVKTEPTVKLNESSDECYCLKSRNLNEIDVQCFNCAKWFHKSCIEVETGPLVRFMVNYQFVCKKCNPTKTETFVKKQASFHQLCLTALANLTAESRNNDDKPKQYFSKDKEIIPFIDKNWDAMTNVARRSKPTWHATISRSMTREDVFKAKTESRTSEQLYGLKETALEKIGPFNENSKLTSTNNLAGKQTLSDSTSSSLNAQNLTSNSSTSLSKRGSKRKTSDTSNNANSLTGGVYSFGTNNFNSKKRGGANDLARLEKMVPICFPSDHPYNKDGYRYHLVEPDPHSPMRQKFEETELWAGKPLPGHLYRLFLENKVAFALHDRAPQLKLSEDRLCVTGEKGYSMLRATHGTSNGSWYFEVTIKEKPNSSAFRIGWAQPLSNLQAPCGYDKFSYSWRSRKGTVFHDSIGKSYSRLFSENNVDAGYGIGDTLGFYIHLPSCNSENNQSVDLLPENCKEMTLVKFKNHLYYEEKDNFTDAEKKLTPLVGSKIAFFKNGICHGVAFKDIYKGMYYPAVSVYKNASAVINFGPKFKYPITEESYKDYKPMSNLAEDKFVHHTLSDMVYHVEHEGTYD